jgi:hypothetical protein
MRAKSMSGIHRAKRVAEKQVADEGSKMARTRSTRRSSKFLSD